MVTVSLADEGTQRNPRLSEFSERQMPHTILPSTETHTPDTQILGKDWADEYQFSKDDNNEL